MAIITGLAPAAMPQVAMPTVILVPERSLLMFTLRKASSLIFWQIL